MTDYFNNWLEAGFPAELTRTPFDDNEYLASWFTLLAFGLTSLATFKKFTLDNDSAVNIPATYMTTRESYNYLAEYPAGLSNAQDRIIQIAGEALRRIQNRLEHTAQHGSSLRLEQVRERFELDFFAFFCVVCALACETDRAFERLFTDLHGDNASPPPTMGAFKALFGFLWPKQQPGGGMFDPGSQANQLVFQRKTFESPLLRPLLLMPQIPAFIQNQPYHARALGSCSAEIASDTSGDAFIFCREQIEQAEEYVSLFGGDRPNLLLLSGRRGCGKKTTLGQISGHLDMRFLLVESEDALRQVSPEDLAQSLVLEYKLHGMTPALFCRETRHEDGTPSPEITHLLAHLGRWNTDAVLLTSALRAKPDFLSHRVLMVEYPLGTQTQSVEIWRAFAQKESLAADIRWEEFVSKYTLTPGQIQEVLQFAAWQARRRNLLVDARDINSAILRTSVMHLGNMAQHIPALYTWDDLVLSDASRDMLHAVCQRVKNRSLVETEWGFGKKFSCGKGVSVLLYGPPGTGKTMSAQVIANELEQPLYRIDLSQLISKYIGETAKNLDHVFHEAENGNIILFFDEADSIFAKRTEVKNSNDRHANSESAYLLQKIEEFSGVSILATNLAHNMDDAFRRRVQYIINIHLPSSDQRLGIWKKCFPPEAPLAPDVDFGWISENLEISGSVIKSAALKAAYFAAADNQVISMKYIGLALRIELAQLGKPVPQYLEMFG